VVALTEKIKVLTKHFAQHKKDFAGMRGFKAMLYRRKKMLDYLKHQNVKEYERVCEFIFKRE
jgi:small subunit ribosomal protein S15